MLDGSILLFQLIQLQGDTRSKPTLREMEETDGHLITYFHQREKNLWDWNVNRDDLNQM